MYTGFMQIKKKSLSLELVKSASVIEFILVAEKGPDFIHKIRLHFS